MSRHLFAICSSMTKHILFCSRVSREILKGRSSEPTALVPNFIHSGIASPRVTHDVNATQMQLDCGLRQVEKEPDGARTTTFGTSIGPQRRNESRTDGLLHSNDCCSRCFRVISCMKEILHLVVEVLANGVSVTCGRLQLEGDILDRQKGNVKRVPPPMSRVAFSVAFVVQFVRNRHHSLCVRTAEHSIPEVDPAYWIAWRWESLK